MGRQCGQEEDKKRKRVGQKERITGNGVLIKKGRRDKKQLVKEKSRLM